MSLLHHAPRFSTGAAAALAHDLYGVEGDASPLPSERDQNFRIRSAGGAQYVLKIANATEPHELLEAQNAAMIHAAAAGALCPRALSASDGGTIASAAGSGGVTYFVRLVTWLPGTPLGVSPDHPGSLLEDIGRRVGELDRALGSFDHPAIHRAFYWDLANAPAIVRERAALVADPALRDLARAALDRFEARAAPLVSRLRRGSIHNDANEYNVLVEGDRVSGILDFGDMVYGWIVGDLAIATAYAVLDKPDPFAAAAAVERGYREQVPLDEAECAVLMPLVCLRLAASVCIAASQTRERPDDPYLGVSQAPIVRTLPRLLAR